MRRYFTLSAALFLSIASYGQLIEVSGSINDPNENKPVQNAVVALLTPKDSILYKFTRSDANGKYNIKNVQPGNYILMTTHPYFADLLDNIEIKSNVELPAIALLSKVKILQDVIIKTGSPIKIKGDTTIYTADSFKVSANANVEELLKKLPGIQVDKDGKIQAMGETVQKVLVDGEEFFGDDPGMAIKNLRADAVKEVQVFDKKSDQAEFTGIDDGKTQKTINLKLKEDKKTGYFGKIDLAAGPQKHIDNRFNNNLMFSSFKGKRKLSTFLLNGNTGQDGLTWQDEQKYGAGDNMVVSMDDDGGIMIMGRGGTSDDEPYFDTQNGFITNINAGASYNNKWNDKHTVTFSPKYNSQRYENHKQTFTQTQVGDSLLNENSDVITNINRYNIKTRLTYDLQLDSNNSLKIIANANFYHTESTEGRASQSKGGNGNFKNTSNRSLETTSDKTAFSGNLLFKHKFAKLRRTLSSSIDLNSISTEGKNFLKSINQGFSNGLPSGGQLLNQMKDYDLLNNNLAASFIYTEPLSKLYSLELSYRLAYSNGNNDQITYNYSPVSGKYDFTIDSLSNEFKQIIVQNMPAAKINFANKKLKVNAGAGFGITDFQLQDLTLNKVYDRNYVNFSPQANITYTYKANHSIRFTYSGSTRQPTINQLQPLRNNNDYFNQYVGNPDLKPSFGNSFSVSQSSYNFLKDIYTYFSGSARFTNNQITNSRTIDKDSGKTVSRPINTNGNYSFSLSGGSGFKLKKLDLRVEFTSNMNYSRNVTVINNLQTFTNNLGVGLSSSFSKSKENKYDVSVRENFNYNSNTSTGGTKPVHYNTNNVSVNGIFYIQKIWSIRTDYQFSARQKVAPSNTGINTHVMNARFQRTFKDNEFTLYLMVRDVFNQNIGIDRNYSATTYSEVINDRLKRYFMVGFSWDFKNKTPKQNSTPAIN